MSDSDSESAEEDRPNRWTGIRSTWASLTEQERGLATTLDTIRAQDLSLHLYNAHALKDPQHAQKGEEEGTDDIGTKSWIPNKTWTAWPLPPDQVPRREEHVGPEDDTEHYTFKKREVWRPSRELEEALIGITLKHAKERFNAREPSGAQWEMNEVEDELDAEQQDSENEGPIDPTIKESSQPPPQKEMSIPVVSADDGRSRELLRPSIRHTLSKLDDVLMALHHSRKICHQYASHSEATTDDEPDTRANVRSRTSSRISKRARGRPRKFADVVSGSESRATSEAQGQYGTSESRVKTTRRGRPKKQYPRLEGETEHEYNVRIARLQKKPLPSYAPPVVVDSPEPSSPAEDKPLKKSRVRRASLAERAAVRQKKLGLRDWSEVLGAAALVGFSPNVIARATQRCADIFGESMTIRTMVEAPSRDEAEVETSYHPDTVPSLPSDSSEDEASTRPSSRGSNIRDARALKTQERKFRCVLENCPRQATGFRSLYDLKRHMQKGHRMTESEIEDALNSDSDMDGAVHVDGFLKPLKGVKGLIIDRKPTSKRKQSGHEASASPSEEAHDREQVSDLDT